MAGIGRIDNVGGMPLHEDGTAAPLRVNDLIQFLTDRKRSTKCPHCEWRGGWEIAMQDTAGDEEAPGESENPRLQIFRTESLCGNLHTSTAVICPNCGHFGQIATYKLRQWQLGKETGDE